MSLVYKSTNHNIDREIVVVCDNSMQGTAYHISPDEKAIGKCSFIDDNYPLYAVADAEFCAGDILTISPKGRIRRVFSAQSNDNVLFITGQCNNLCMMCSQPPMTKNDLEYYYSLNIFIVRHIPVSTRSLGITGGEPTLLGEKLIELIRLIYATHPNISLHMLSNGKMFAAKRYASLFGEFCSRDFVIGIPVHSDYEHDHDHIAGAQGAFNQTISGIYNLARYNVSTEIRIVISKQNYIHLPKLSEYIFKNMPFAYHVAFMGMEYTGLTLKNMDQVWIDPIDYAVQLEEAVANLAQWGMKVSIYNIPLCLQKPYIHIFSRRSISDWKESFNDECTRCSAKTECCGLFATSKIQSLNIKAID